MADPPTPSLPEPAPVGQRTVGTVTVESPKISARDVNVFYGEKHAIKHVDIDIGTNEVIAFIGPSGCGKSTFLRCLNRMNDTIDNCRVVGTSGWTYGRVHDVRIERSDEVA